MRTSALVHVHCMVVYIEFILYFLDYHLWTKCACGAII